MRQAQLDDAEFGKPSDPVLARINPWRADFKGQFKTGNGRYRDPLTVADSRCRSSTADRAAATRHGNL